MSVFRRADSPTTISADGPTSPGDRYCLTPIAAMLLIAAAFLGVRNWADYDVYWHLANGRLISAQGVFPSPDRYTWSAADKYVALNSVRFDQLAYQIWNQFGGTGLSLMAGALFVGAVLPVALFLGRLRLKIWWEALALGFLTFTILPFQGLRPHLIGAMILGFMAHLAERPFGLRKGLMSGILLGIWLNYHGSFVFGFALLGAAVVSWTLVRDVRAAGFAALSILVGAVSTVFSPYGRDLWLMPVRLTANKTIQQYNVDWDPLRPFKLGFLPMALLIVAALVVGIWRLSDPRAWAAILFILPTLQYARFIPLAAPILVIVIADRLVERWPSMQLELTGWLLDAKTRGIVNAVALGLFAIGFGLVGALGIHSLESAAKLPLPTAAVDKMLACGATGDVWNDYSWGGYLVWRSNGALVIGMDGRAETVYDSGTLQRYFDWASGVAGWEQTIQQSPAKYALFPTNAKAPIDQLPGWRRVFADGTAVVAIRDGAAWTCPVP